MESVSEGAEEINGDRREINQGDAHCNHDNDEEADRQNDEDVHASRMGSPGR